MGTRGANHVTPLYPQKLALTSPTSGGRSVGMVRSRTKATEFSFSLVSETVKYVDLAIFSEDMLSFFKAVIVSCILLTREINIYGLHSIYF